MKPLARRTRLHLLDLIALASVVATAGTLLFLRSPWEQLAALEWDEGYYVGLARGIATGQSPWFFPVDFEGTPIGDKPPLFLWCMALSIKAFGDTLFAVRLPSAIAAFVAVAVMYLLGRRIVGPLAAWCAAMVMATAPMVYCPHASWSAVMEAPTLLLCTSILLTALWVVADDPDAMPKRRAIVLGALFGLLLMTKSGVVLLPLVVLGAGVPWLSPAQRRMLPTLVGHVAAAALVVGGAWPLVAILAGEGDRLLFMWGHHVFERATKDLGTGSSLPTYLAARFSAGLGPWCFAAWACLVRFGKLRRTQLPYVLGWLWICVGLGAMSLSSTQWYWYALPIVPGAALLIGVTFDDLAQRRASVLATILLGLAVGAALLVENVNLQQNDLIGPFDDAYQQGITLWLVPAGGLTSPPRSWTWLVIGLAALLLASQWVVRGRSVERTIGTRAIAITLCLALTTSGWFVLRWAQWDVPQPKKSTGTIVGELYVTPEIVAELEHERTLFPDTTWLRWLGLVQPFVRTARPEESTAVTLVVDAGARGEVAVEYLHPDEDAVGMRHWERIEAQRADGGYHEVRIDVRTAPDEPFAYRFVDDAGPEMTGCSRALYLPRPLGDVKVEHTFGLLRSVRTPEPLRSDALCSRPEYLLRYDNQASPLEHHVVP